MNFEFRAGVLSVHPPSALRRFPYYYQSSNLSVISDMLSNETSGPPLDSSPIFPELQLSRFPFPTLRVGPFDRPYFCLFWHFALAPGAAHTPFAGFVRDSASVPGFSLH